MSESELNSSMNSTTSSNIWREGERILKGEIDLSESMQLCLDGDDPQPEREHTTTEETATDAGRGGGTQYSLVGEKGKKGIENYLKRAAGDEKKHFVECDTQIDEFDRGNSNSFADTVRALLNSPQPAILSPVLNKENRDLLGSCGDTAATKTGSLRKGLRSARKRSLTEMSGHNPLSKDRIPLGEKRCFETDL